MDLHLVSHTHWDREWYHTADVFRQRLVNLVDELIDDTPGGGESFLLDGQAIIVEDYLAVRPDRRDRLQGLLRDGRLEAGPWYVLADELIPSGEALVRNLLAGRSVLVALGATSPPVLYCPDSFGHPAALPEIAAGFGLPLIVLWRGYGGGRWPRGDVARWRAPSGTDALVFHLPPDGYEYGASLPVEEESARMRWDRIRATLSQRSTVGTSLLLNGADHHARQSGRDDAVRVLAALADASGDRVRRSSLREFSQALIDRASAQKVPAITGELRDSYGYTWTLAGTLATRAVQKRGNAMAERILLREAEPWAALAWFHGGASRSHHVRAAWKSLLRAQPHDTLCGTSIDEVAVAADARIGAAHRQAGAIAVDAVLDLLGHDAVAARGRSAECASVVIVRNAALSTRQGVASIELVEKLADEPVGPGSGTGPRIDDLRVADPKPRVPTGMQLLESQITRDRLESPRHYPDNDIVRVTRIAMMVGPIPALGLAALPTTGGSLPPVTDRVRVSSGELTNGQVTCRVAKSGIVSLEGRNRVLDHLIHFEDRVDRGDLYTPSIGDPVALARFGKVRVTHRGPLIGEACLSFKIGDVAAKSRGNRGEVEVAIRVTAGSPLLELGVSGTNTATNHRLRIGLATGIGAPTVVADAAFGPVDRRPVTITATDAQMETAPATAPLHRYVSLFSKAGNATVYSDGLAEYEVDDAGVVWITLVRAVGDLSRNDLPERPGHAGWPADTPGAQSIGPFEARFGILIHDARTPATIDEIEAVADQFLLPLRGFTLRSARETPATYAGPELSGTGLAFSTIKHSEDGQWLVLRCVNLTDRDQSGRWTLPRAITEAKRARLDETPLEAIPIEGQATVPFGAGPRAVITILVR